jgi:hypothetical protein
VRCRWCVLVTAALLAVVAALSLSRRAPLSPRRGAVVVQLLAFRGNRGVLLMAQQDLNWFNQRCLTYTELGASRTPCGVFFGYLILINGFG